MRHKISAFIVSIYRFLSRGFFQKKEITQTPEASGESSGVDASPVINFSVALSAHNNLYIIPSSNTDPNEQLSLFDFLRFLNDKKVKYTLLTTPQANPLIHHQAYYQIPENVGSNVYFPKQFLNLN